MLPFFFRWVITADPLIIKIEGVKLEIDLAAEKVFAAEKAGRKIAFEVKSFLNSSAITDFHSALGQFLNYRLALQMSDMMSWKSPIIKTLRVSLSPRLCVSPNYG